MKLQRQQATPNEQFEEIIHRFLCPYHSVLDAGCGRRARVVMRGRVSMVVGVDVSEQISSNLGIDVAVRADLSRLPFRNNTFDVIVSWMVVEHLDNPQACFAEFGRVCKDGGLVVLATPSLLHYAPLMTALTPFSLHEWCRRHVLGWKNKTSPTRYGANTPKKLVKMMQSEGFIAVEVRCIDPGLTYLVWLTPLYAAGLLYHRLVNRFEKLSSFRAIIIAAFRHQREDTSFVKL